MYKLTIFHTEGPKMGHLAQVGHFNSPAKAKRAMYNTGWRKVRRRNEWVANTVGGCLTIIGPSAK